MASRFDSAVIDAMRASAPLNMEKATAIAEQFGEKPRAIIAAAIRAGIEYQRAAKRSKDGSPVQSKEDMVSAISARLGVNLDGLEKATKASLGVLLDAIK